IQSGCRQSRDACGGHRDGRDGVLTQRDRDGVAGRGAGSGSQGRSGEIGRGISARVSVGARTRGVSGSRLSHGAGDCGAVREHFEISMLRPKPDWLKPLFPWEQRSIVVNGRTMAYIDEGDRAGRPVLLLSGNPTWGFLYRDFIEPLTSAGYRT